MQDVICLYMRFARQLPSNFNNINSICSLLCISKQCNYKPHTFLTNVKPLEVRKTPSNYGISFWFYTHNTQHKRRGWCPPRKELCRIEVHAETSSIYYCQISSNTWQGWNATSDKQGVNANPLQLKY